MLLTDPQKEEITKILKRFNRKIWRDELILRVIENIEAIKEKKIKKTDYFIPEIMTYEDYLWQLNLIKFL